VSLMSQRVDPLDLDGFLNLLDGLQVACKSTLRCLLTSLMGRLSIDSKAVI
jgi:hypothetical protein